MKRLPSLATRRELIEAIAGRYNAATRADKRAILDEFINVTGFHRKHASQAWKRTTRESAASSSPPTRWRLYDEAARGALTILWEAVEGSDPDAVGCDGTARAFAVGW